MLRSLPLPNLSAVTPQGAKDYFDNSWTLFEMLFAGLKGEEPFYRYARLAITYDRDHDIHEEAKPKMDPKWALLLEHRAISLKFYQQQEEWSHPRHVPALGWPFQPILPAESQFPLLQKKFHFN